MIFPNNITIAEQTTFMTILISDIYLLIKNL